jgi:hypothetical protein
MLRCSTPTVNESIAVGGSPVRQANCTKKAGLAPCSWFKMFGLQFIALFSGGLLSWQLPQFTVLVKSSPFPESTVRLLTATC